jgi:hypothetical protein
MSGFWSPYEQLVKALEDACDHSNCRIKYLEPIASRFRDCKNGEVIFDGRLHLMGWPERGSSTKEQVNILVHVDETIRSKDSVLLKSKVRVWYFHIFKETAKLIQSLRFDYNPEQDTHPLFHSHLSKDEIPFTGDEADRLGFKFKVRQSQFECFDETRIPTSDMTFSSVLLCLTADHLKTPIFSNFKKSVCNIQVKMPHPLFDKMKESISKSFSEKPCNLRSSHWFAHLKNS